jgi:endonuclease-8
MPEGPEIRRAADRIARAVEGRVAEEVFFGLPRLTEYADELTGRRVEGIETRGKAMLTHFDCGLSVYSHNQLYGRWYVVRAGTTPRTNRQLRFAIHTADRSALLYSASEIAVLETPRVGEHPFLAKLGPDVSMGQVDVKELRARLRDRRFRGRQLASLYLDQGFLAGLGNYLRAEILFAARVGPHRRPKDLDARAIRRLADKTIEVCGLAYRQKGVTLPTAKAERLQREGVPRRARKHWVYARGGRPCLKCRSRIERRDLGGRHIYLCPTCQGA